MYVFGGIHTRYVIKEHNKVQVHSMYLNYYRTAFKKSKMSSRQKELKELVLMKYSRKLSLCHFQTKVMFRIMKICSCLSYISKNINSSQYHEVVKSVKETHNEQEEEHLSLQQQHFDKGCKS